MSRTNQHTLAVEPDDAVVVSFCPAVVDADDLFSALAGLFSGDVYANQWDDHGEHVQVHARLKGSEPPLAGDEDVEPVVRGPYPYGDSTATNYDR
tara:strand:+ start:547 stop:831 length:285 start_codon:yes stop_codon:yes gene_type:complete